MPASGSGLLFRVALTMALLVAPVAAGDVHVVDDDGGPGVDFTLLEQAVGLAADGDTILVKDGSYNSFSTEGKSFAVVAEAGASVTVDGWVSIKNLAPGQFVSLAGLEIDNSSPLFDNLLPALELDDVAGTVWLERCLIRGANGTSVGFGLNATPGIEATSCAAVTLIECTVIGGSFSGGGTARPAILAVDTSINLFDTLAAGGIGSCTGLSASDCAGQDHSGDGVLLDGGSVYVAGGELRGGAGNSACWPEPFPFCFTGKGGDGLDLAAGTPSAVLLDVLLSPGTGQPAGQGVAAGAGTVNMLSGVSRDLRLDSPVREQGVTTLQFDGQAGELAWVFLGALPTDLLVSKFGGPILVGSPYTLLLLGTLDAGGALVLPAAVGNLPPAMQSLRLLLQATFVEPGGAVHLSDPVTLLLLDAQF